MPQYLMSSSTSLGPGSFLLMLEEEEEKSNVPLLFARSSAGQPDPVELLVVDGLPGDGDRLVHVGMSCLQMLTG